MGLGTALTTLGTVFALTAALFAVLAAYASAAPPILWETKGTGGGGGEVAAARGSAVDPSNGHIFVADQNNRRVSEFDAWGIFVKTWGWDVVLTGPGDDTVAPEDQFEICVPSNGDVCKAGNQGGEGAGQFSSPAGVAVDSAGAIYVYDKGTGAIPANRLQKFDAEGNFEWMVGGGVNKGGGSPGNPGNLCTAQHIENGDTCGAGAIGIANGSFGNIAQLSTNLAVSNDDKVYVGDVERIQRFNAAGEWQENIALVGKTVNHLAVDAAGNLYVAYRSGTTNNSQANVVKLSTTGAELPPIFEVSNPRGLAIAPDGDVYAFEQSSTATSNGGSAQARIRHFDPSGKQLETIPPASEPTDLSSSASGLSVGNCGTSQNSVYHSNNSPGFIRAYSEPPDPDICGKPPVRNPDITAQYAVSVGAESARLGADINPWFWEDAVYYVQYGTATCIETASWEGSCVQESPAPPGAPLKGGVVNVPVTAAPIRISGLEPETAYRYRFVAESGGGGPSFGVDPDGDPKVNPPEANFAEGLAGSFTTFPLPFAHRVNCPNQAFRAGASAHLPDCRAYELVSPVDKEGGETGPINNAMDQSANDGGALTYSAVRAFGEPESAPSFSQHLARRDEGRQEWTSRMISPPRDGPIFVQQGADISEAHYKAFSEDLCTAWNLHPTEPTLASGAIEGFANLYRRDNCGPGAGSFEALTTVIPADIQVAKAFLPEIQGFSADGSLSIFRAPGKLIEGLMPCSLAEQNAVQCTRRVYAFRGGTLRLVSVLPDGTPSEAQVNSAGTGEGTGSRQSSVDRAVSADGSRVVWSAGTDALYVRLNPTAGMESPDDLEGNCTPDDALDNPALACTVEIVEASNVRFWSGAADGHKVIYSVGLLSGAGAQLYEFDLATQTSTLIAEGVRGVAGTSSGASHVYFASNQALSTLPNSEGDAPQAGKPNLYHYLAGEGGGEDSYDFVATLAEADVEHESSHFSPVSPRPDKRTSRVSPDGSSLAFNSTAAATDYDNTDLVSGKRDAEVFLYDATVKKLVCVSCNPTGARPTGKQIGFANEPFAAIIPGWPTQTYPSRALVEDGGRLFFDSYDALVLADTNGKADVYEWEAVEGSGAKGEQECEELGAELHVEASGGCLSLISSGTSSLDSEFRDASLGGRDVFFRTASSLVAHDPGLYDVYDAREGGGFPAPASPIPPCEGEACQSAPAPPAEVTPASAAFQGPGNATPRKKARPCGKGKRRTIRKGKARCVKKKARRGSQRHARRAPR